MSKLNHTWEKDEDFKPDGFTYQKFVCKRCGCEKYKSSLRHPSRKRWFSERYSRSGMNFENLPECIDWSDNTLD